MSLDASKLYSVNGLVALITGGGTGVGAMMAKVLAQNGAAKVYIAARRLDALEAAAKEIGPNVIPVQCDVTDKDSLARLVKTIEDDAGYLNLLVCNSGVTGVGEDPFARDRTMEKFIQRHWEYSVDEYLQAFKVNVAGTWYTTIACLPLLEAGNNKGNVDQTSQVIVVSSTAGVIKNGYAGFAYGQSKAASIHLMKQLSLHLMNFKMRANCIAPGFFPSELTEDFVKHYRQDDGSYANVPKKLFPLGRLGDEKDMGGTLLYLASRAGAYTNGTTMLVEGGILAKLPSLL
ncbi:hypothetical protein PWT90_09656 [Aphanocladium album]|nr:hypothetical protein PWT90_09656 [Aphanocladium album]